MEASQPRTRAQGSLCGSRVPGPALPLTWRVTLELGYPLSMASISWAFGQCLGLKIQLRAGALSSPAGMGRDWLVPGCRRCRNVCSQKQNMLHKNSSLATDPPAGNICCLGRGRWAAGRGWGLPAGGMAELGSLSLAVGGEGQAKLLPKALLGARCCLSVLRVALKGPARQGLLSLPR